MSLYTRRKKTNNMGLLTIGIVQTRNEPFEYQRRFYSWGYADIISPGKQSSKYDIVIIPDKISAYAGMKCWSGRYEPIGLPPMDNLAESFRINPRGLEYYAANSLVIGIGDGALMLWDFLGYKAVVKGEKAEIKLIKEGTELDEVYTSGDLFVEEWRKNNFVGLKSLWSPILGQLLSEQLAQVKDEIKRVRESQSTPNLSIKINKEK